MMKKLELIADWRTILRWPSIWLAFVASAVTGFILANPTFLFAFIAFFPADLQLPAAIGAALLVLVLVVSVRVLRVKRNGNHDPEADAEQDQ